MAKLTIFCCTVLILKINHPEAIVTFLGLFENSISNIRVEVLFTNGYGINKIKLTKDVFQLISVIFKGNIFRTLENDCLLHWYQNSHQIQERKCDFLLTGTYLGKV